MRVLVVSSLYERPGAFTGQHVHRLCQELSSRVDLRVFCPLPRYDRSRGLVSNLSRVGERPVDSTLGGVRVSYTPYANVPHVVSLRLDELQLERCLVRTVDRLSYTPDIVHAHWLVPTGAAALSLARRLGIPCVVTAHGSDVHTYPARSVSYARAARAVISSADQVTAVSGQLARAMDALGPSRRPVRTVHSGVDTERFVVREAGSVAELRTRLGLPSQGTGIVSVARLAAAKGVFELLSAFATVCAEHPHTWLAIVGGGPAESRVVDRIADLGLTGRVILAGARPYADIPGWLGASDIFVLASHAEGLPTAVLEAMACGVPVIATDVGGTAEALGDTGVIVPPADVPALAKAMSALVSSRQTRHLLADSAVERARIHFSVARAAEDYLALYAELAGAAGADTSLEHILED